EEVNPRVVIVVQGVKSSPIDLPQKKTNLISIGSVHLPTIKLNVGETQLFQAMGTFEDASTRPLTSADGLQWSSSDPDTVSIDMHTGKTQALKAGEPVTITATVGTVTANVTVQVQQPVEEPVIHFLSPSFQTSGGVIAIHGQNIRNPSIPAN